MGYNSIAWLPLCAGLTVLGFVLSYLVGRRRGRLSMLRGAAWSLLPIAAYLTGSVEMFWKIGAAVGHFADGFVFSPVKWAGIAVAGISVLLFTVTRGRGRRKAVRDRAGARDGGSRAVAPEGARAGMPAAESKTKSLKTVPETGKPAVDDDMREIEEILRQRGIG